MRPDTSHWRADAPYVSIDDAWVDYLAWECLRRNAAYQQDYALLLQQGGLDRPLPDLMERRWGLRFRGQTASLRH